MSSPLVFSGLGLSNPPHIYPHVSKILARNDEVNTKKRHGLFFAEPIEETEESESSSIGAEDEESSEEGEEAESKRNYGAFSFSSLESIEESLPIKRGLSNHFSGKSKSFASLSGMGSGTATAADLAKPENPLNKRRRILLANKARRASYSSFFSTCDTVLEGGDEENEDKVESSVAAASIVF